MAGPAATFRTCVAIASAAKERALRSRKSTKRIVLEVAGSTRADTASRHRSQTWTEPKLTTCFDGRRGEPWEKESASLCAHSSSTHEPAEASRGRTRSHRVYP